MLNSMLKKMRYFLGPKTVSTACMTVASGFSLQ